MCGYSVKLEVELGNVQTIDEAHRAALDHIVAGEQHYLALGCWLIVIEDDALWDQDTYEHFNNYLEAPRATGGLGLDRRAHQRCRQIARKYVHELEVPFEQLVAIPQSNLAECVGIADRGNVREILVDAAVLTVRDMRLNRSNGKYHGEDQPLSVDMPPTPPQSFSVCPNCGTEITG